MQTIIAECFDHAILSKIANVFDFAVEFIWHDSKKMVVNGLLEFMDGEENSSTIRMNVNMLGEIEQWKSFVLLIHMRNRATL